MKRCICTCCIAVLLVSGLTTSCSVHVSGRRPVLVATKPGPPPHAPAHGRRRRHIYRYRYYPSSYVYFDIERNVYFHMYDGSWKVSAKLPAEIHINAAGAVSLSLETAKPYVYFNTHKAKYPPGQVKKRKAHPWKLLRSSAASKQSASRRPNFWKSKPNSIK